MDRYDKAGIEVQNYELAIENVGLYMWVKRSDRIKLVRIAPVFDKLPRRHRQAVISYIVCMANCEVGAMNEGIAKDDHEYQEFHL